MFPIIADTLFAALGRSPEPPLPPRRRAEPAAAARKTPPAPTASAGADAAPTG